MPMLFMSHRCNPRRGVTAILATNVALVYFPPEPLGQTDIQICVSEPGPRCNSCPGADPRSLLVQMVPSSLSPSSS
ncbi:hypothetical protein CPAR01_09530 [Colletotrichum paranaense]|uniref:Uncharacterized protein n=1 Tax=Colletotrichum paranaense TaxID=1914294 RepID=A0ABQ9SH04_9PEZI|nr:uncharacterized protein CPAR01_09530 [Colletotrichum paranaense]KAK1535988.1 hypothetical protein CPAR01_09530 [Colletotrichum paranaense]